jgi:hypothetical protein
MIDLLRQQIASLQNALSGLDEYLDGFSTLESLSAAEASAALGKMLLTAQRLSERLTGTPMPEPATISRK